MVGSVSGKILVCVYQTAQLTENVLLDSFLDLQQHSLSCLVPSDKQFLQTTSDIIGAHCC
ncbi:hypothetical protein Hanom_Chr04g00324901 [Helianthus anomalus]